MVRFLLHLGAFIDQCFRVEKYRPVTLDDVVSHKDITSTSKWVILVTWVQRMVDDL